VAFTGSTRCHSTTDLHATSFALRCARHGSTATLTFTRTTDDTARGGGVIPDVQRNVFLPLHKPASVQVPGDEVPTLRFRCGTEVCKGALVVR